MKNGFIGRFKNVPFKLLFFLKKIIFFTTYRKIPLIRPGRIYGQRTNLMGLYSGVGGGGGVVLYTGGKTLQFAIC